MVAVDYKLTVDGAIADQSQPGAPLEFICGTGMLLPKFEEAILGKEPGEKVAFTLSPKDGYGEVIAEAIVDLPKNTFMVDGKLAEDILFAGSQVPMSDAQGNRMIGTIKEVGEETVKMDFNHPMAGKTLNFEVEVVSVRDVTPEDLQSAGGCSCGCDGGCGDHEEVAATTRRLRRGLLPLIRHRKSVPVRFSSILQVESLRFSTCFYLPFILLSMLHSIRQFIEALQDPYGLTRTLGEIEVCRSSDGEPCAGSATARWFSKPLRRPVQNAQMLHTAYGASRSDLSRETPAARALRLAGRRAGRVVRRGHRRLDRRDHALRSRYAGRRLRRQSAPQQLGPTVRPPGAGTSRKRLGARGPETRKYSAGRERHAPSGGFRCDVSSVFAGEKSPELGTAAYQHPGRTAEDFDASIDDYSIATISTTLHALALEPGLLARYNRGEGLLLSPRKIVRHGCAAHAECLALFEKAGDAVRYRIARLLESPLMRLPNLKPLVRYAVCGPETPADRGELFVRDGLWGFKIGERELIPPIYDAGFDFTEGLAAVRTGRCWHFIDPTGAVAIDCSDCNAVKPFANGRAIVVRDGQRLAIGRKEPRTTLHI